MFPGSVTPTASAPHTWSCPPAVTSVERGNPVNSAASGVICASGVPLGTSGASSEWGRSSASSSSVAQRILWRSSSNMREASEGSVAATPHSRKAIKSAALSQRTVRAKASGACLRSQRIFHRLKIGWCERQVTA